MKEFYSRRSVDQGSLCQGLKLYHLKWGREFCKGLKTAAMYADIIFRLFRCFSRAVYRPLTEEDVIGKEILFL